MDYYFLDWLAMSASLGAVYLLGQKSRTGFALFMFSNVLWVAVGWWAGSYGIMAGNVAFLALNLRGWRQWTSAAAAATPPSPRACP